MFCRRCRRAGSLCRFFTQKRIYGVRAVCSRSGGAILALYRKEIRVSSYIAPACGRTSVKKIEKEKSTGQGGGGNGMKLG
jgi:hypothetical protein